jgi:hypothetical protein
VPVFCADGKGYIVSTYLTPTTTLIVTRPTNFHRLETRYKLIRYELPEILYRASKNDCMTYSQVQNSLYEQLDCPYKLFKHDRLDGDEKWVVYALYPRYAVHATVMLPLFSDAVLSAEEIAFEQLDLYSLLSLLQIVYCCSGQARYFTGQDLCYVLGKHTDACLQIELLNDGSEFTEEDEQEIKVVALPRRLQRISPGRKPSLSTSYFARKEINRACSFFQIKQSDIDLYKRCREPLYEICAYTSSRVLRAIEEGMSKQFYDFLSDFSMNLVGYGIICHSKTRLFDCFGPYEQEPLRLSLVSPGPIAVFDHRLNQAIPFQLYLPLLAHAVPDVQFVAGADVSQPEKAIILQDYEQEDFEPQSILAEHLNPFADLFCQYSHLPWQPLSVNMKPESARKTHGYLDYALPKPDEREFCTRVEEALTQLALKDILYYQRSVQRWLPFLPQEYIFIRKNHAYETMLYFENDTINFLDLRDASQVVGRDDLFSHLGVDWATMYERMLEAAYERGELEPGQEPVCYDVIVGPDLFVELISANERVLYRYDEIIRRDASMDVAVSIEDLKLLPHYDDVGTAYCLPFSTLMRRGLLEPHAPLRSKRELVSLKFYHQLEAYDAFLTEVKRHDPLISFNRLTQGTYWEEIIRIFELQPDKHGSYSRGQFKGYYQKRGWFCKGREKTGAGQQRLEMYEGIWYDDAGNYIVGPRQPFNQRHLHAHPIWHFAVHQGAEHFESASLLRSIGIQYAYPPQHRQHPYAFHLIDLYVESWLCYAGVGKKEEQKNLMVL